MHTPSAARSRQYGDPLQIAGRGEDRSARRPLRPLLLVLIILSVLLALAGLASASAQSLSPGGPVDFGGVAVGNTSGVTTLVFSVPAGDVVTVGSITAITLGAPNKDFAIPGQSCVGTIAGPATCNISLTFAPSVLGLRIGELFVKDGSGNVTNHVPLRGAGLGPQMVVSPRRPLRSHPSPASPQRQSTPPPLSTTAPVTSTSTTPSTAASSRAPPPAAPRCSEPFLPRPPLLRSPPSSSPATARSISLRQTQARSTKFLPLARPSLSRSPASPSFSPPGWRSMAFGYLYVADAGANQIVRIDIENGNAAAALTLTGLGTALSSPQGLSVDAADNLYVADANNNRIVKIDLHTSTSLTNPATVLPISGLTLSSPTALVVNAAGGLSITDTGNNRLVELPLSGSPYVITLLNTTPPPATFALTTPAGVTLLPTGDLLVSDTVAGLVQVTRTTSSLIFPTPTLVGTVDTVDGDLALDVENTGSYALQVAGNSFPSISNNAFFADTTGTCPNTTNGTNGTQVSVGEACTLEVGFKPTVNGPNTGTLNVSASGNGNVTANVALTGTGFHVLDHFTVTVAPSTVTPGQPTTMTVTAINNDGTVDDTYTGTINLTCTDPACVLPTGAYTFTAADNGIHTFASTLTPPLNFNTLGTWTVTVTDTTFKPGTTYTGTSNLVTVITTPAVTLTSSVNPVLVNANTTLTATVSSPYGTPTGTVTFLDGSTVLGTGTLDATGVATLRHLRPRRQERTRHHRQLRHRRQLRQAATPTSSPTPSPRPRPRPRPHAVPPTPSTFGDRSPPHRHRRPRPAAHPPAPSPSSTAPPCSAPAPLDATGVATLRHLDLAVRYARSPPATPPTGPYAPQTSTSSPTTVAQLCHDHDPESRPPPPRPSASRHLLTATVASPAGGPHRHRHLPRRCEIHRHRHSELKRRRHSQRHLLHQRPAHPHGQLRG